MTVTSPELSQLTFRPPAPIALIYERETEADSQLSGFQQQPIADVRAVTR